MFLVLLYPTFKEVLCELPVLLSSHESKHVLQTFKL